MNRVHRVLLKVTGHFDTGRLATMARISYLAATLILMILALVSVMAQDRISLAREDDEMRTLRDIVIRNQVRIRALEDARKTEGDTRERVIRLEHYHEEQIRQVRELKEQMDRQNMLLLTISLGIGAFLAKELFRNVQFAIRRRNGNGGGGSS